MANLSYSTERVDNAASSCLVNEPTVEEKDQVFIRKTIEFIQTLPGADKKAIEVQTNTSFPSRYVLKITNLPIMNLSDFESIKTLAPKLRSIQLCMKENWIKVDMWKANANVRKNKRKFRPSTNRKWNLKNIGKQDQSMLKQVLDGFSNLPSCPCQFQVDVSDDPPNFFHLDIVTTDIVREEEISKFQNSYRAFVKKITFHFPSGSLRIKVEKASANAKEKRRRLVFKRS